ncbi:MAG: hypothetical protein Q6373_012330 [Candidatus Sigynarchaeota archaeon]
MSTKRKRATTGTIAPKASPAERSRSASQLLGRMTTVKLRRLLVEKKVLQRTKCKTKRAMIDALQGVMDLAEIETLVEQLPEHVVMLAPGNV